MLNPFKIEVSDKTLDYIRTRVQEYPWDQIEMRDDGGWLYGTNLDYLKEFCEYWVNEYDWRKHETKMNQLSHFTTPVDGINMHFIQEKGSGPSPMPLLINHGWPGTVIEFIDIIEPLAHPERFGGNIEDAFDVIAPSLPGFGFSGRPSRPMGPRKMAEILNSLMTDSLGYKNYMAQGGDWGSVVSNWRGYDHAPACSAIHVNCAGMRHADGLQTSEEVIWQETLERDQIIEDGYRTQQATKPQTLAYSMTDSPEGIAAWILEKFNTWSDTEGDNIESAHSKDTLLTNIMVYNERLYSAEKDGEKIIYQISRSGKLMNSFEFSVGNITSKREFDINKDYTIAGMAYDEQHLYIFSEAYSTIFKYDPDTKKLISVYGVNKMHESAGITLKEGVAYSVGDFESYLPAPSFYKVDIPD